MSDAASFKLSRIGIIMLSVTDAHRALTARGVAFRVEPRVVSGDDFAADFRDPDGHVLSIFGKKKS